MNNKVNASLIIKQSCCGSLLDVPKCELLKKVENLEAKVKLAEECFLIMNDPFELTYQFGKDLGKKVELAFVQKETVNNG